MTAIENTSSFGYWIRRHRKALDLTQAELAELVGCALPTIKKIESDERRPSLMMAQRLAECLEIPESEKEMFIKVARQVYSPERFTQKNKALRGKTTFLKKWVSRMENKVEQAIGEALGRKQESIETEDDPSHQPDFGG
jgi:transcriptional regulator with XRE-family HTH domain